MRNRPQKQGSDAESFIAKKLTSMGWRVIPTPGSKSPIDLLAYHKGRRKWWGIQVKSIRNTFSYDFDPLSRLCNELHFVPILAWVDPRNRGSAEFAMRRRNRFYHVSENGTEKHPLGEDWDCGAFKAKLSIGHQAEEWKSKDTVDRTPDSAIWGTPDAFHFAPDLSPDGGPGPQLGNSGRPNRHILHQGREVATSEASVQVAMSRFNRGAPQDCWRTGREKTTAEKEVRQCAATQPLPSVARVRHPWQ